MNKKVSLKEVVANQIVYAIILVSYYWMWARDDWKNWYPTVQMALGGFLIVYFMYQMMRIKKYKREGVDEMAEQNLRRCDSICLKVILVLMIFIAWFSAVCGHINAVDSGLIGWMIVLSILAIAVFRTVLFILMDSKEI